MSLNHSNWPVLIDFVLVAAWRFLFVHLSSSVSFYSCRIPTWHLSVLGKLTVHSGLMWIVGTETLCSQLWKYYITAIKLFWMLMWYTQCLIHLRKNRRSFVKYLHLSSSFPSLQKFKRFIESYQLLQGIIINEVAFSISENSESHQTWL